MAPDIADPTIAVAEPTKDDQTLQLNGNGTTDPNGVHKRKHSSDNSNENVTEVREGIQYNPSIRWPDLVVQIFLHVGAAYGLFLILYCRYFTWMWCKYILCTCFLCGGARYLLDV